eukprot:3975200-Amphidinium_carterae.1
MSSLKFVTLMQDSRQAEWTPSHASKRHLTVSLVGAAPLAHGTSRRPLSLSIEGSTSSLHQLTSKKGNSTDATG